MGELNKKEIFEYCLVQKMANLKECILKEHANQRAGDMPDDWPAEEAYASDFVSAMERLKILEFGDEK